VLVSTFAVIVIQTAAYTILQQFCLSVHFNSLTASQRPHLVMQIILWIEVDDKEKGKKFAIFNKYVCMMIDVVVFTRATPCYCGY